MTHEVSCTQGAGTGLSTYMRSSRAIQVDSWSWFHVKQGRFWAFACPSSCRYAMSFMVLSVEAGLVVVGFEVVATGCLGAAGPGLSGWVVLNHPSDRRKPRCYDPP